MSDRADADEWWLRESVIKIQSPSCIYIGGSLQSGKSSLVRRLIRERDAVFSKIQRKTEYRYNALEPELTSMASEDPNIILHEGLSDRQLIDEWSVDGDWLLVLDDLLQESADSKDITYLFTMGSHHKRATVIIM
jgi:hypothetical protein